MILELTKAMSLAGAFLVHSHALDQPRPDDPPNCPAVEQDIDQYFWERYLRTVKIDSYKERARVRVGKRMRWRTVRKSEDFTWKDAAAAMHADEFLKDYLLNKVPPTFKLRLYLLSRTLEARGMPVGFKSFYRDDYRQGLITHGVRAPVGLSQHREGLAVDMAVQGSRQMQVARIDQLVALLRKLGPAFGLRRPLPRIDPLHVELGPVQEAKEVAVARVKKGRHRHARMAKHHHRGHARHKRHYAAAQ
jgi:hypothetical protein